MEPLIHRLKFKGVSVCVSNRLGLGKPEWTRKIFMGLASIFPASSDTWGEAWVDNWGGHLRRSCVWVGCREL